MVGSKTFDPDVLLPGTTPPIHHLPSTVRKMRQSDLPNMVALCQEHAEYESQHLTDTGQITRLTNALFGPQPRLYGWLVVQAGRAEGFMTATIDFATWTAEPFVHMDCLYLRPSVRRLGMGRALITTLREFAVHHQCTVIQWQTPPSNQLGIDFYNSIGATNKPKLRFFLEV